MVRTRERKQRFTEVTVHFSVLSTAELQNRSHEVVTTNQNLKNFTTF